MKKLGGILHQGHESPGSGHPETPDGLQLYPYTADIKLFAINGIAC